MRLYLLLSVGAVCASGCAMVPWTETEPEAFVPTALTAKFARVPVEIDGKLDDAAWLDDGQAGRWLPHLCFTLLRNFT